MRATHKRATLSTPVKNAHAPSPLLTQDAKKSRIVSPSPAKIPEDSSSWQSTLQVDSPEIPATQPRPEEQDDDLSAGDLMTRLKAFGLASPSPEKASTRDPYQNAFETPQKPGHGKVQLNTKFPFHFV